MTTQSIVLGGGCFWCTEAVFMQLIGVCTVTPGYMGGLSHNAQYQAVCTGTTDHIEVVHIVFDPTIISLDALLSVFFAMHDPTTQNRQGADIGRQYASVIFATTEQKQAANAHIKAQKDQGIAVVTEVLDIQPFYPAESYHHNFYAQNPTQGYCQFTIAPKLAKLHTQFAHLLA